MLRLLAATLVVAATTADDAIWLIPYVASPQLSIRDRIIHGLLFLGTLETMVLLCVLTAQTINSLVSEEWVLGAIGAILCWGIALFLYVRKILKKKRREKQKEAALNNSSKDDGPTYGSVPQEAEDPIEDLVEGLSLSPMTVISLTFIGALDEVSYFPSLLLGKVFSAVDLCLGTLFASCLILAAVTLFLSQCKPLLDWLDRIPLYAVLSVFATILTAGAVFDYISEQ